MNIQKIPEKVRKLKQIFEVNADFHLEEREFLGTMMYVCYLVSLVDVAKTNKLIHFYNEQRLAGLNDLKDQLNISYNPRFKDVVDSIIEGNIVCIGTVGQDIFVFSPIGPALNRSISTPQNENFLQSPAQGFIEDFQTNLGMLRSRMKSPQLIIRTYKLGENQLRNIAVCYKSGVINETMLQDICTCLESNRNKNANNLQQLLQILGQKKISLVPTLITTELPAEAEAQLDSGKVILFLEGFPFALILPAMVSDLWSLKSDYNLPFLFMQFNRFLRIIGLIIALIAPGMYVALIAVNPEVLRIQLALSIAQSREGVPYPALIEVLLMLFILEMIVEASVRMPKNIGPTITMVGGVILGQAVVQAKLVSNLLIIILAATAIANFTLVGIQNVMFVRVFKYGILFLSSVFGLLGLTVGIVILSIYISKIVTFNTPYLSIRVKEGTSDG
ncbi:MAG: spore germination protein [Bacillota bacterium]